MARAAYSALSWGLLTLLLVGCGGTVTPPGSSTAETSDETSSDQTTSDEVATETFTEAKSEDPDATEEGGGTEEAGGGQVELPGLPIGGFWDPDFDSRCVVVNWSGPPEELPGEVTLEVTSLAVTPTDTYTWVDGGCEDFDLEPCLLNAGVLADGGQCEVLVHQTKASPDGSGTLSFISGVVSCGPGAESACEQFATAVAEGGDAESITWDDAIREGDWPTTGSTETTTDPTTDTDPPTATGDDLSGSTG
jgi:hypothetical protein